MFAEFFTDMPVLIKVLGSIGLMLLVNAGTRRLGVSLALGTVLLAFWSGHSLEEAGKIAGNRFVSVDNICLLIIVVLVIWLSAQMQSTGVMSDLVTTVRRLLSQRAALAALPAIIGILPMPGGAVFSAPMLDECDAEQELEPMLKTRINYWFRHVWEYWWPLYPGVLLAIDISGVAVWQFIAVQFPITIVAIAVGSWFFLRRLPAGKRAEEKQQTEKHSLFKLTLPILAVIGFYAIISLFLTPIADLTKYAPMLIALCGGIIVLQFQHPLDLKNWKSIVLSKRPLILAGLVALVRIYGAFIEAELPSGNFLVDQMRLEMAAWGIPFVAIIMVLPFLCGIATGLSVGFVGASFPVVFNLLGTEPTLATVLSTIVLAYGFGYMGMILSPVHICLIVTNEHFRTRLIHSLKGLIPPSVSLLTFVTLIYFLARVLQLWL